MMTVTSKKRVLSPAVKSEINRLSAALYSQNKERKRRFRGKELQILSQMSESAELVTSLLSLKKVSSTFLFAAMAGTMHAKKEKDGSGFLGPIFFSFSQKVKEGIYLFWLKEEGMGIYHLLETLLILTIPFAAVFGASLQKKSLNIVKEEIEKKSTAQFFQDLTLTFLAKAKVIESIFSSIAKILTENEKIKAALVATFSLIAWTMILLMVTENGASKEEELFSSLKHPLQNHLETLVKTFPQGGDPEVVTLLNVLLETVKEENFGYFRSSLLSQLTGFDATEQELTQELKDFASLQERLAYAFTEGLDDKTNQETYIVQSV